MPLISVVMPVWNGEKYLAESMESLFAQTFRDFELIVVDDGSTDATPEILRSYTDPRLRHFRLDHAGIVTALNFGVEQARAEWIGRQDADDISLPARLGAQWDALNRHPGAVLSHTEVEVFGEKSAAVGHPRFPRSRGFTALKLCFQCPIVHSSVIFNKQAFTEAGGYRPEERHAEDYALWGRLIERGPFVGLPQALVRFRVHSASVSKQNLETQVALTRKIATEHCRRFMALSDGEARRAYAVLGLPPSQRPWKEWRWFLTRCAPRLRWKSGEAAAWLLLHSLRQLVPSSQECARHRKK